MLNFIIGLIIGGGVVGVIVWLVWANKNRSCCPEDNIKTDNPMIKEKQENLAKLEKYIAQKAAGEEIANDEVQRLLKVSDATAERYLEAIEQKGIIKQVGAVGRGVIYQKH